MKKFIQKIKIPYELLETTSKKDFCPMTKIGYILKSFLNLNENEQIDVSKIWINTKTDNNLENYFLKYIEKQCSSKKLAKQKLGWYKLQISPAIDIKSELDLEDDYIYIEEKFIKIKGE